MLRIKRKIKKNIPNIIILVITILICIIFFELLLRLIYPLEYNLQREFILSDYGIFLRKPNLEYIHSREEFTQPIKINSKGLRDYEHDYEKDNAVYRIAMVGDSFTEAVQVKLGETIPKRLEKKLNQNEDYEVINFGFNGYGLTPEAVLIEEEVIKYNPDMIILNYYIGNDFAHLHYGAYKNFLDEFWLEEKHDLLKEELYHKDTNIIIRNFLRRNFMIYYLIKKNIRNFKGKGETVNTIKPIYEKNYSSDLNKRLNTTHLIFKFLNSLTIKNDIPFIVVLIPTKEQTDINIFNKILNENNKPSNNYELEKPQRLIIKILESLDIKYIDLLPSLKKANINNTFYWETDGHFNKKGCEFTSEIIYERLINKELIN